MVGHGTVTVTVTMTPGRLQSAVCRTCGEETHLSPLSPASQPVMCTAHGRSRPTALDPSRRVPNAVAR